MAATRKLQGEIDRCLKKVTEGVETFEDIWQKVHNATNSNQKEKYEADLKKEIKKLQRLRDQIKSWIASGEIKDKSTLLEYRKLIETQMERFKVVERETKTKAYSKEGLGAAQKMDPAQREREEISAWLVTSIDALNLQVDQFESEIESLLVGKKKRLDKEKQDRMEELKGKLDKHRFHIKKLETLLRMLDNMSVEVEQIRRIKDDVEYYIDSSQEPGFEENEYIYDDIRGLDEIELSGVGLPSSATTDSNSGDSPRSLLSGTSPINSPALEVHNHSTDSVEVEKKKKEEVIAKPVKPLPVRALSATPAAHAPLNNSTSSANSFLSSINNTSASMAAAAAAKQPPPPSPPPPAPAPAHAQHAQHANTNNTEVVENGPVCSTPVSLHAPPHAPPHAPLHAPLAAHAHAHPAHAPPHAAHPAHAAQHAQHHNAHHNAHHTQPTPTPKLPAPAAATPGPEPAPSPITLNGPHNHTRPPSARVEQNSLGSTSASSELVNSVGHLSPAPSPRAASPAPPAPAPPAPLAAPAPPAPPAAAPAPHSAPAAATLRSIAQEAVQRAGLQSGRRGGPLAEAHIPPLLGVAPLGPLPLNTDHQVQFQMMESSFYHMPHPADSARARLYLPRSLCPTPHYYNQTVLPHSDTVEFFQRLSTETLFFVFYYMEGSKAQYLAAKALKKQSWRFHTKYMMWFQRHEEPKVINEEYEQGTYIYFDYEKWGQRKKEGFTFEYKYLEDRDLN